jgi:PAS domain S-box-containing protein
VTAERVALDHELPPLATSAGEARRLLRAALADETPDDAVESAQLAVSEIVTNALVHAGTPMRLRVLLAGRHLRVELSDGSPRLPRPRRAPALTSTGRGLSLVTELVDRWGAYPDNGGKVVWFEIADQGSGLEAHVELADPAVPDPDTVVEIELLNLPVLMHLAWQEHAAQLLREYLLYALEDDPAAIENHAAMSDALGLLAEQIPGSAIGGLPAELMAAATEPHVSIERFVLRVERHALDHFIILHQVLEGALQLADRGELMTPPAQPEVRMMRRWLCEQVWIQGAGGLPSPWQSDPDAEFPGSLGDVGWDAAGVNLSERAVIAADDTNRIVGVSDSALAALGYAARAELVGSRLIRIIPWRFHQAHVAGFTLHLANGRDPLLGRRVVVPVVRADGSEVELELRVDSVPLVNGRKVFTAELFL